VRAWWGGVVTGALFCGGESLRITGRCPCLLGLLVGGWTLRVGARLVRGMLFCGEELPLAG
jgi:hypothetical protein